MATADESLAGGGISGYGTRREDEVGRQGLRLGVVVRDMVPEALFSAQRLWF